MSFHTIPIYGARLSVTKKYTNVKLCILAIMSGDDWMTGLDESENKQIWNPYFHLYLPPKNRARLISPLEHVHFENLIDVTLCILGQ